MRKNRLIRVCAMALVLLALMAVPALAKVVSPGPDFYYLDNANVLSEKLEGEIFFANKLLYDACGAQIVVVTVDSTGRDAIDDYAYELFNSWGIGDAAKDNGFLLLLAIQDEDYYALCGAGLQSKFTSGSLKQYFDQYLETDFAAGRYDAGVKKFFEAVFSRVADTYNANVTTAQGVAAYEAWASQGTRADWTARAGGGNLRAAARPDPGEQEDGGGMFFVIIGILLILLVVAMMSRSRRRVYYGAPRTVFFPVFFGRSRRTPPPPPPMGGVGPGGYRGAPGMGGYRTTTPRRDPVNDGLLYGLFRSMGSGAGRSSGGASRPSSFGSSGRSSGFGSARGSGGFSRGGGAGRGRH